MPNYDIIKADYEQYNRVINDDVLNFPGSIFYHPEYLRISADILNLEFSPLICLQSDEVAGLMNLLTGRRLIFKTALIPKLFQYYGPHDLRGDPVIHDRLLEYVADKCDTAIIALLPGSSGELSGWLKKERITYMLKPDTFENLKKNCASDIKNKVNKAMKAGVEIKKSEVFDFELYDAGFRRQGLKPPVEAKQMTDWVDRLTGAKFAETYVAYLNARPVAIRTLLVYQKYAYTWVSGILPDFRSLGVNSLLVLTIGEILYKRGITTWDFGGGDIKSIGRFKQAFGATAHKHFQCEKNFNWKGSLYRMLMRMKAGLNG